MSDIYKECMLSKRKGDLTVSLWRVYQENDKGEKVYLGWEIDLSHRLLFGSKIIKIKEKDSREAMVWYNSLN